MHKRLEHATEALFWEAWQDGKRIVVRYGLMGQKGLRHLYTYPSPVRAAEGLDSLVRSRLAEGYNQVSVQSDQTTAARPWSPPVASKEVPSPSSQVENPSRVLSSSEVEPTNLLLDLLVEVAKSDGLIREIELDSIQLFFEENLEYSASQLDSIRQKVTEATVIPLSREHLVERLSQLNQTLQYLMLGAAVKVAWADGELDPLEAKLIRETAEAVGLPSMFTQQLEARLNPIDQGASASDNLFRTLGLRPGASTAEITERFSNLLLQLNPGQLARHGSEFVELAKREKERVKKGYSKLRTFSTPASEYDRRLLDELFLSPRTRDSLVTLNVTLASAQPWRELTTLQVEDDFTLEMTAELLEAVSELLEALSELDGLIDGQELSLLQTAVNMTLQRKLKDCIINELFVREQPVPRSSQTASLLRKYRFLDEKSVNACIDELIAADRVFDSTNGIALPSLITLPGEELRLIREAAISALELAHGMPVQAAETRWRQSLEHIAPISVEYALATLKTLKRQDDGSFTLVGTDPDQVGREAQTSQSISDLLETPIGQLGLRNRTHNALRRRRLLTVGDLLKKTAQELLAKTPSFGYQSWLDLIDALTTRSRKQESWRKAIEAYRESLVNPERYIAPDSSFEVPCELAPAAQLLTAARGRLPRNQRDAILSRSSLLATSRRYDCASLSVSVLDELEAQGTKTLREIYALKNFAQQLEAYLRGDCGCWCKIDQLRSFGDLRHIPDEDFREVLAYCTCVLTSLHYSAAQDSITCDLALFNRLVQLRYEAERELSQPIRLTRLSSWIDGQLEDLPPGTSGRLIRDLWSCRLEGSDLVVAYGEPTEMDWVATILFKSDQPLDSVAIIDEATKGGYPVVLDAERLVELLESDHSRFIQSSGSSWTIRERAFVDEAYLHYLLDRLSVSLWAHGEPATPTQLYSILEKGTGSVPEWLNQHLLAWALRGDERFDILPNSVARPRGSNWNVGTLEEIITETISQAGAINLDGLLETLNQRHCATPSEVLAALKDARDKGTLREENGFWTSSHPYQPQAALIKDANRLEKELGEVNSSVLLGFLDWWKRYSIYIDSRRLALLVQARGQGLALLAPHPPLPETLSKERHFRPLTARERDELTFQAFRELVQHESQAHRPLFGWWEQGLTTASPDELAELVRKTAARLPETPVGNRELQFIQRRMESRRLFKVRTEGRNVEVCLNTRHPAYTELCRKSDGCSKAIRLLLGAWALMEVRAEDSQTLDQLIRLEQDWSDTLARWINDSMFLDAALDDDDSSVVRTRRRTIASTNPELLRDKLRKVLDLPDDDL